MVEGQSPFCFLVSPMTLKQQINEDM